LLGVILGVGVRLDDAAGVAVLDGETPGVLMGVSETIYGVVQ
jgi:hypothetical protein